MHASSEAKKPRNLSVDLLRLLAVFGVVVLHFGLPGRLGPLGDVLFRFSVPFFFVVSGYFCFGASSKTIYRRTKKIVILMFAANVLYLALRYMGLYGFHPWSEFAAAWANLPTLFNVIVFNASPVAPHLWFLTALAMSYAFYALFMQRLSLRWILAISLVLLFLGLAAIKFKWLTEGSAAIDPHFLQYWQMNWIFTGVPFFGIGAWIKANEERLLRATTPLALVLLVLLGSVLAWLDAALTVPSTLYLGTIVQVVALYLLALKVSVRQTDSRFMRMALYVSVNLSLYIYILHIFVQWVYLEDLPLTTALMASSPGWGKVVGLPFIFVVSAVLAFAYLKLKQGVSRWMHRHKKGATR